MPPSRSGLSPNALGWALLSQVFWLPLVAIDLHDRWQAHQREITPPGQPLPSSPLARARPFSLNDLLGATRPVQQLASQANQAVSGAVGQAVSGAGVLLSSAGSGVSSLLDRPFSASVEAPSSDAAARAQLAQPGAHGSGDPGSLLGARSPGASLLSGSFTRAQLLGGSLGLGDLQEGPMAPLALAERALQRGSGDPLAPLPSLWREPMRQALLKLPGTPQQLSMARTVYLPSSRISQPVEVPLALQSDGSVDILQAPDNPAVLGEIEGWTRQQRPPASGTLQPALVHLHPLGEVLPARSQATALSRPAEPARGSASLPARPTSVAPAAVPAPVSDPSAGAPAGSGSASPSRAPSLAPRTVSRFMPAPAATPARSQPSDPAVVSPVTPVQAPAAAAAASRVPAGLLPPPPLPSVAEVAPPSAAAVPAAANP